MGISSDTKARLAMALQSNSALKEILNVAVAGGSAMLEQLDYNENELLDEIYRVVTNSGGSFIGFKDGMAKDQDGSFLAQGKKIKNIGLPYYDADGVNVSFGLGTLSLAMLEYYYMQVNSNYKRTPIVELVQDTNMALTGPVIDFTAPPFNFVPPYQPAAGIFVDGEPLFVPCADFYGVLGTIPFTPAGLASVINPTFFHVQEWSRVMLINQTNPAQNGIYKVFFKDLASQYVPVTSPVLPGYTYELVRHFDNLSAFSAWPGFCWSVMRGAKYGRSRWMIDQSYWDILNYGTAAWNPFVPTSITFKRLTAKQLDPIADLGGSPTLTDVINKINEYLASSVASGQMLPSLTPPAWL
jgi:hypothetical protein